MAKSFLIPGVRPGNQPKQTKREVQPNGWTSQRNCAVCGRRFFIIFSLIFPRGGSRKSKGEFRALRSAASLRGWIAPGLRPGPVFACGRDEFSTLSPMWDEVKLRESSAGSPGIRPKACWTVFGNHATIKRENHRMNYMISKT